MRVATAVVREMTACKVTEVLILLQFLLHGVDFCLLSSYIRAIANHER